MKIIKKVLRQRCVYWKTPLPDGYGGFTFEDGIVIKCRWEDKSVRFLSKANIEDVSRAYIMVDRDVDIGGYLLFNNQEEESQVDVSLNPEQLTNAYEIKGFDVTPTLKATHFLREAII